MEGIIVQKNNVEVDVKVKCIDPACGLGGMFIPFGDFVNQSSVLLNWEMKQTASITMRTTLMAVVTM